MSEEKTISATVPSAICFLSGRSSMHIWADVSSVFNLNMFVWILCVCVVFESIGRFEFGVLEQQLPEDCVLFLSSTSVGIWKWSALLQMIWKSRNPTQILRREYQHELFKIDAVERKQFLERESHMLFWIYYHVDNKTFLYPSRALLHVIRWWKYFDDFCWIALEI